MKIRKHGIALAAILIAALAAPASADQTDIEAQIQDVVDQLTASGETYFTVATTDGESIVVTLTSQSAEAQSLTKATRKAHALRVRASVPVKVKTSRAQFKPLFGNAIGGGEYANGSGNLVCTGGFTVVKNGVRGILTAGHCINNISLYIHPTTNEAFDATHKAAHLGQWGDLGWFTTSGSELDNFYGGPVNGTYDVASVKTSFAVGDTLDWYGQTTGFHNDQDVKYTSATAVTGGGFQISRLVCFSTTQGGAVGDHGDSGGPVYKGSIAAGVITGFYPVGGQGRMCFSRAMYIDDAIPGLSIATS